MTLGWKPRLRLAGCGRLVLGQLDDFDGARAVRQAADEAALDQRRDQAVNAGLGFEIERVLHLVEGRRHAALLHALVDEEQQLFLFLGQHHVFPFPALRRSSDPPRAQPASKTVAGAFRKENGSRQNRKRTLHVLKSFCKRGGMPAGSRRKRAVNCTRTIYARRAAVEPQAREMNLFSGAGAVRRTYGAKANGERTCHARTGRVQSGADWI